MADGRAVAQVTRGEPSGPQQVSYIYSDHLGSTNVVENPDGTLTERRQDPFGNPLAWNGATLDPRITASAPGAAGNYAVTKGFTGKEEEGDLGVVNMGGRIYDPRLGRFLQADPIVVAPGMSQPWNRYAYGLDNPMRFIDPTGMAVELGDDSDHAQVVFDALWEQPSELEAAAYWGSKGVDVDLYLASLHSGDSGRAREKYQVNYDAQPAGEWVTIDGASQRAAPGGSAPGSVGDWWAFAGALGGVSGGPSANPTVVYGTGPSVGDVGELTKAQKGKLDEAIKISMNLSRNAKFIEVFRKTVGALTGKGNLPQELYASTLNRVTINIAEVSKDPLVRAELRAETAAAARNPNYRIPPAFQIGEQVYLRATLFSGSAREIAAQIMHETAHVAGAPGDPLAEYALDAIHNAAGLPR